MPGLAYLAYFPNNPSAGQRVGWHASARCICDAADCWLGHQKKSQHCGMTLQSAGENLGALHPKTQPIILNGGDCCLRNTFEPGSVDSD